MTDYKVEYTIREAAGAEAIRALLEEELGAEEITVTKIDTPVAGWYQLVGAKPGGGFVREFSTETLQDYLEYSDLDSFNTYYRRVNEPTPYEKPKYELTVEDQL